MKISGKMPCFLMVEHDKGMNLLNLNQVAALEKISDEEVRLIFSPTLTYNIHGKAAMQLLTLCAAYSIFPDGTPMMDIVDKPDGSTPSE